MRPVTVILIGIAILVLLIAGGIFFEPPPPNYVLPEPPVRAVEPPAEYPDPADRPEKSP